MRTPSSRAVKTFSLCEQGSLGLQGLLIPEGQFTPGAPRFTSIPHVRGGLSGAVVGAIRGSRSSPRAWGSFPSGAACQGGGPVFPTCVGVFPWGGCSRRRTRRLPHVREGPTPMSRLLPRAQRSSPRCGGLPETGQRITDPEIALPRACGVSHAAPPTPLRHACSRCMGSRPSTPARVRQPVRMLSLREQGPLKRRRGDLRCRVDLPARAEVHHAIETNSQVKRCSP